MKFDLEMTDALLATTRAVRRRLDLKRAVPRQVIMECLELAVQAPTGGNRQGWRWVVVDDANKRKALADIYREAAGTFLHDSRREAEEAGDRQTARVYQSAIHLLGQLHDVPLHVIPCIEGFSREDTSFAIQSALFGSIYPAIWSFQLALRARGLGSVLTTMHLFRETEVAALLGIPEEVMQVALLPVAFTVGTDFKHASRPPAADVTHWNQW